MRAFQIQDVKSFMSHLLLSNTFDRFLLTEASITTFNTFFIDGHLHKDYFSSDEAEMAELTTYSYWERLRPFALSRSEKCGKTHPSEPPFYPARGDRRPFPERPL